MSMVFLLSLIPLIVGLGLAIYLIILFRRLVLAVEKIAEKQ
ncbi:MAG: hypothetical protein ACOY90_05925 [Candidatus Zhuqueibacterota bacterium]